MTDLWKSAAKAVLNIYNRFVPLEELDPENHDPYLTAVRDRSRHRTDISDHLETLYRLALDRRAGLVVELGVRTGESTFALEQAVCQTGGWLVSVDIEPTAYSSEYEKWRFLQVDDLELARMFADEMAKLGAPSTIDLLFLDTSHTYEHTVRELAAWMPLLSETGAAVLHDTNMARIFRRRDGSLGGGWNNRRGVIQAVEERFQTRWDEKREFSERRDGFQITHVPWCSGLTILERISA